MRTIEEITALIESEVNTLARLQTATEMAAEEIDAAETAFEQASYEAETNRSADTLKAQAEAGERLGKAVADQDSKLAALTKSATVEAALRQDLEKAQDEEKWQRIWAEVERATESGRAVDCLLDGTDPKAGPIVSVLAEHLGMTKAVDEAATAYGISNSDLAWSTGRQLATLFLPIFPTLHHAADHKPQPGPYRCNTMVLDHWDSLTLERARLREKQRVKAMAKAHAASATG